MIRPVDNSPQQSTLHGVFTTELVIAPVLRFNEKEGVPESHCVLLVD